MYKIFKKKDRMISAVSKFIDTLTFRKQKNEMRYIKISTFFICLMFSIQSISSQSIDQIRNVDIDSYSDSQIASYWNNQQITVLDINTSFAGAFGILAYNNNLYVGGSSQEVGDSLILRFWLNGEVLSDPIVGEITSITKLADDIYYAGFTGSGLASIPTYWKNDEMVLLPSGDFTFVKAFDIFVK